MFFLVFIMSGCGDTSSSSSNLTSWTLSDPYKVGGEGSLILSSTTEGKLDGIYENQSKISTNSLNSSEIELIYARDEKGRIVSGKFTSETNSIDLSK